MATGFLRATHIRLHPYLEIKDILLQERVRRLAIVFFRGYECYMTLLLLQLLLQLWVTIGLQYFNTLQITYFCNGL